MPSGPNVRSAATSDTRNTPITTKVSTTKARSSGFASCFLPIYSEVASVSPTAAAPTPPSTMTISGERAWLA